MAPDDVDQTAASSASVTVEQAAVVQKDTVAVEAVGAVDGLVIPARMHTICWPWVGMTVEGIVTVIALVAGVTVNPVVTAVPDAIVHEVMERPVEADVTPYAEGTVDLNPQLVARTTADG